MYNRHDESNDDVVQGVLKRISMNHITRNIDGTIPAVTTGDMSMLGNEAALLYPKQHPRCTARACIHKLHR